MVIQISRGHVVGILDEVRTKVLDWAIEMEKNGVTGNGLTFSKAERVEANAAMPNINIGSIGNFAGNMGSGNSAQDIAATSLNVADVANLSAQLNSELEALVAAGADRGALVGAIQSIQEEVDSGLSDKSRLKTVLSNTKDVLVGAGGNLTAQGAISAISKLLESFG